MDVSNVRVVQRRQYLGFTLEPREPFGIVSHGIGQNLIATSRFSVVSVAR